MKAVPRQKLTVRKYTAVSIDNFQESDILREIRATRMDGSEFELRRKTHEFNVDAIPSIL
ncbi:hypothetical protein ANN_13386, partial [Periplaneta americana]